MAPEHFPPKISVPFTSAALKMRPVEGFFHFVAGLVLYRALSDLGLSTLLATPAVVVVVLIRLARSSARRSGGEPPPDWNSRSLIIVSAVFQGATSYVSNTEAKYLNVAAAALIVFDSLLPSPVSNEESMASPWNWWLSHTLSIVVPFALAVAIGFAVGYVIRERQTRTVYKTQIRTVYKTPLPCEATLAISHPILVDGDTSARHPLNAGVPEALEKDSASFASAALDQYASCLAQQRTQVP